MGGATEVKLGLRESKVTYYLDKDMDVDTVFPFQDQGHLVFSW